MFRRTFPLLASGNPSFPDASKIERIAYFDWQFAVLSDGFAFRAISNFIMECGETD